MPFPCSKSALAFYWPWDETPYLCAVAPKTPSSSLIAGLVQIQESAPCTRL